MTATDRQAEMLANRLRKNTRHLRKWAKREGVSCYRIYDRDIPEIPIAVDRYDDHLYVSQFRAEHRPHTEDPAWLPAMIDAAREATDTPPPKIHIRLRERTRTRDKVGASGRRFTVEEAGLKFWVNLDDYLDTGLFLDHRTTRAMVAAVSRGARVLNLFCYTGSFTVYAAAAAARSSVSVDLSNTYLDWARDNLGVNGLATRHHELVREDVFEFLAGPARGREPFDVAVLDPPTFSNSKKMTEVLDINRDHPRLIGGVRALLRPGGTLYFSTNARSFSPQPSLALEDITPQTVPPDFSQRRPHRCYRWSRPGSARERIGR